MKKLNVGIVSYDFNPPIGGQGIYTKEIYNNLDLKKINPIIISGSQIKHDGYNINSSNNFIFSIKFNFLINKLIKRFNLDILHLQGGPGGVFLLRKIKIPVIYTAHHSYWSKYKLTGSKLSKLLFYLERVGYNLSDKIIAPSNSLKNILIDYYSINKNNIIVIPEGFNPKIFYKIKVNKIKNSVLFVGRLHRIKAIDKLIYAIDELKNKYPSIKLFIIGDGDQKTSLLNLVKKLNLKENISFLGNMGQTEINKWYNQCEMIVLPSYFEGFGLVVLEAAGTGLLSITTKNCGVSDIVFNEKIGLVVDNNSPIIIANSINKIFTSTPIKINSSHLSEKYSWKEIASRTKEVYLK